jgi:methyl-accepting chemotaxis protein
MRLRRDAVALILGTSAVVIGGMAFSANRLFSSQMAEIEAGQFKLLRTIVDFNLQGGQERALSRAELLAATPAIREAFASGDRDRLLSDTQALFEIQRDKYGLDQLQFVTADNVSFLRVHKPEKFGDDLSSFRPIVVAVNQDHVARRGISLSRTGPALMGVVPMLTPAGEPAGLVEMGLDFGPVLDRLKATYGFDLTFFVQEEPLRAVATSVDPAVLDETNRVGAYLKYHSTNWERMRGLVSSEDLAAVSGDSVEYTRENLGVPYGVVMVSLKNAAGDPIGVVASAKDFSDTRAAGGRVAVVQAASSIFGLIVLAGAVAVAINGFLLRPLRALSDAMAALAAGDAGRVVDLTGSCEELAVAADRYEALRASAARPLGRSQAIEEGSVTDEVPRPGPNTARGA